MCDGLIETVKYIWMNILCMLDWILSQNCRNTLPLHAVDQLARSQWNILDAVVPIDTNCLQPMPIDTNCLKPTPTLVLMRWKNIKIQVWV